MNANHNDADTLYQLAGVYLSQGKLEEASACLQKVIALKPDCVEAHFNLGIALTQQDKLEAALTCFQKVLTLNPYSAEAYYNIGVILAKQEKLEQAIAYFQKVLEFCPEDVDTYKNLGDAFLKQNQLDAAITCFQKLLQLQPDSVEHYNNLLLQLTLQSHFDKVIVAAIKALQLKPNWAQAYLYIGYALQQKGRKEEAFDCALGLLRYNIIEEFLPEVNSLKVIFKSESAGDNHQINYLDIYPENQVNLSPPITSDENIIHKEFLYSSLRFAKTFIAIVSNGKVWVDFYTSAIITSDGLIVEDVSTGNAALIALSNQLPAAKKIDGTVACLAIRYSHNYFHWMFDLLPRIEFLGLSEINLNNIDYFIVNRFYHTFQKETLSILGIDNKKILEVNGYSIQAKDLIATSSSHFNKGKIQPQSCNFLRRAFLKVIEKSENTGERIYISRKTASYRRVINESEVTDFLKKYGFKTIQLESMSVTEQIKQMAAVKVVIAPHGAGLTNIVFCNPGTKIIEIFSPDEVLPYYWIISSHIGLEYYYLIGNKVEDTSFCQNGQQISIITKQGNIFVDINVLFKVMKLAGLV